MSRESAVAVVVFVMQGCPACHEYAPAVQAAQRRHPGIPVYILDAASRDPSIKALADRHDIRATPTTLVLRRPAGVIKVEGSLDGATLEQLMQIAERHR